MMNKVAFVRTYCQKPPDSDEVKQIKLWLRINVLPHMIEAAQDGKNKYDFYIDNREEINNFIYEILRENGYYVSWWPVAKTREYPKGQTAFRIYW